MKLNDKILLAATLVAGLALAGCQRNEGAAEQAGKKVDQAMQDAGRKVDEAAAAASAGAKEMGAKIEAGAKQAVDATGKAVEKTGEKMQDAVKK